MQRVAAFDGNVGVDAVVERLQERVERLFHGVGQVRRPQSMESMTWRTLVIVARR
jgi:hypothetical protein